MKNWLEMIKEDVNREDGVLVSLLTNFTSHLFKTVIIVAIPIYLLVLLTLL